MLGTPPDRGSTAPPSSTGSRFISIAANHPGCLGLRSDATVEWIHRGYSSPTHLPIPERLIGVAAIAVGENHVLALLEDGTVTGWTSRPELHLIDFPTDLDEVVAIAAGEAHSLALKSNGEVVAWGWTEGHRPTWVPSELQPVTQIAAGDEYNLAIQEDGSVVIWGTRYVPTGPAPDPRDVYRTRMVRAEDWQWTYVTDATAIVAGDELGLNILRDGTVGVVRNRIEATAKGRATCCQTCPTSPASRSLGVIAGMSTWSPLERMGPSSSLRLLTTTETMFEMSWRSLPIDYRPPTH